METPFVSSPAQSRTVSKKALVITLLAVVGLVGCVCAVHVSSTTMKSNNNIEGLFAQWRAANNKTYGGAESKLRMSIFEHNNRIIEEHNTKNASYKFGLNQFSDLTENEFTSLYLGASKNPNVGASPCPAPEDTLTVTAVDTFDWRDHGRVGPVKNQAQCGSCWAFSTVGALEGLYAAHNHQLVSFSEQQLVDCTTEYGNQGCNGGWVQNALHYTIENGIALDSDYPYKGVDGKCNENAKVAYNPTGCANVKTQSVTALKQALINGPVSVYVQAAGVFQHYSSGVVTDAACWSNREVDHAVLAVGYTEDAWIIKNSWTANWGEQGYIRVATDNSADADGVCGILSTPNTYPTAYC